MYYFMVYILGFEMELVVLFLIVERLLEVGGEYYEVELFDGGLVDEVLFYFSEILFYFGMIEFMVVEVMLFIDFQLQDFVLDSVLLIGVILIVFKQYFDEKIFVVMEIYLWFVVNVLILGKCFEEGFEDVIMLLL